MLKKVICSTVLALGLLATQALAEGLAFSWRELPQIPANQSEWSDAIPVKAPYWQQIGLAGPLAGVHRDMLLVGGGANFPEPGLTATRDNVLGKVYWDEVFVMNLNSKTWLNKTFKLPRALAYASTISLPEGVLVIGGEGHEQPNGNAKSKLSIYADVFLMSFDQDRQSIDFTAYPRLPRAMSYSAAALVGRTVYVQSGKDFYALDLEATNEGWKTLPTWPGEGRDLALAAGVDGKFILASGRIKKDGVWLIHQDAYRYTPKSKRWAKLPDMPNAAMAGEAFSVHNRYFVVMGGDQNLERWNMFVALETERGKAEKGSSDWIKANTAVTFMQDHHTGFNQNILVFDSKTGKWSNDGYLPTPGVATTQPVKWKDELLLVSGEIMPGKRTPKIWAGLPQKK